MKKNKLYLLISIITLICFFGTAALCNQCAADTVEETDSTIGEDEITSEETAKEEEETPESEEEETEEEEPSEEEEETSEEEPSEEEEETSEQEEQKEAPTITLEIYEGPIYSSADDVCYYRIKAIVTGNPTPAVVFSKDDSGGAWGSKKAQVNLSDPAETYILTATATNSEGSATDSIDLSWGCPIPNNPPEIADITLMGSHYAGLEYTVSAAATDPDGDSLSYNWSVTGGSIDNPGLNSVKWTMPNTAGSYDITVAVDDGNGGQAEKTETIEVLDLLSVSLSQIPGGGDIKEGWVASVGPGALVGDSPQDLPYRGFLSFDISSLAGKVVISAEMKFDQFYIKNDPYSIVEKIWVDAVYWGTDDIVLGDYDISGVRLGEYDIPIFTCSSNELKDALNQAIIDGHDRFQVRLRHKGLQTNHDGTMDTITYGGAYSVKFNVSYIP